jgi:hypothetical protein
MPLKVPEAAYKGGPAIFGDKKLYARLGKISEDTEGGKELIEKFEIPIRSGKAWVVKKGQKTFSFEAPVLDNKNSQAVRPHLSSQISSVVFMTKAAPI